MLYISTRLAKVLHNVPVMRSLVALLHQHRLHEATGQGSKLSPHQVATLVEGRPISIRAYIQTPRDGARVDITRIGLDELTCTDLPTCVIGDVLRITIEYPDESHLFTGELVARFDTLWDSYMNIQLIACPILLRHYRRLRSRHHSTNAAA